MSSDITLTASIRSNLLSLNNASSLLATTSERLSTGKKVNGALDNPSSFFTARGLTNRASDLSSRKDGLGQAISLLQATDKSVTSITALVEQAKATAQSAEEASSAGISAVSTLKAKFVGDAETAASSVNTEAAVAQQTTNAAKISLAGKINNADAASTLTQFASISGGDAVNINISTAYGASAVSIGSVTGGDTIANLVTNITAMTGLTAVFNTTSKDIDITGLGGQTLLFTDVDSGDVANLAVFSTSAADTPVTAAIATTGTGVFNLQGNGSDLAAAAFGMTDADGTNMAIVIDGSSKAISAAEQLTVDQYTALLNSSSTAVNAQYNLDTRKINITGDNGTKINITTSQTATDLGFLLSGGTVTASHGVDFSLDDGTAVATTDLLTAVYVGTLADDTMQFGVDGGSVGTAFTISATSTIADLIASINASDSSLTAVFNTTTSKLDITAADGTALTITEGGTSGAFGALGFTTSTAALLATGVSKTYGAAGSSAEVGSLNSDFQSILEQIDKLLTDATYKGNNLLKGANNNVVKFNEDGSSSITVTGLDLGITSNTNFNFTKDASGYDFTAGGDITQALTDTSAAITQLRSISATFGADMGVIQTRETFTSELVNVLEAGAGKLVNANLEEESANMLALQTRQALGIQALSISNQSNQSILSLFR
jgi:flagellin-like hook-associated protein FlgL